MLYLTLCCGCEHIHTSERKLYVPYDVGVGTPMLDRGTLTCHTWRVWVTRTFSRSMPFSYAMYIRGVATPRRFCSSYEKNVWVWAHPTNYMQVYVLKHLYEEDGCVDTQEVVHVSFKATNGAR